MGHLRGFLPEGRTALAIPLMEYVYITEVNK
jgi:hypothetical protein